MIDHTNCDHPRTSGARAKCRRANRTGDASVKTVDFTPRQPKEKKKGTPRDRDMQCDVCGVERIAYRGTELLSGVILSVGEKCEYVLNLSEDKIELP